MTVAAAALRSLADVIGGKQVRPAPNAASPISSPLGDLTTAAGASVAVLQKIHEQKLTFANAASFANAVQQILVDLGIEPGIVLEASKLLEAVAPVFVAAWRSGVISGGYPDIVGEENDTNFKNR
jgi:hypothetical protein